MQKLDLNGSELTVTNKEAIKLLSAAVKAQDAQLREITRQRDAAVKALESISGAVKLDYAIKRANDTLASLGVAGYEKAEAALKEIGGTDDSSER